MEKGKKAVEELHKSNWYIEIRLGDILKKREMTQKELADITKLRPNAISNLSRGYIDRVQLEHLARIAEKLDIRDMNELLRIIPRDPEE